MATEWRAAPFRAFMAVPPRNGIHKGSAHQGSGTPVIKMGEVYGTDVIGDRDRDRLQLTPEEMGRLAVDEGDLLFCRTSLVADGVGHCALVGRLSERTVFASNLIRIRLDQDRASSRFWHYYFRSPIGNGQLLSLARGTSVTTITGPDIAALEVRAPDIAQQRAIAHMLGTLDDKIELNRRMNETLEAMGRGLFKSWFVDFDPVRAKASRVELYLPQPIIDLFPDCFVDTELGEIPMGWRVASLGECVFSVKGKSYRSEDLKDSSTALVTLKSFKRGGGYRPDGLKAYAGEFKPEQVVAPGELVLACTDVTQAAAVIGRPALVQSSDKFTTLVASLDVLVVRPADSSVSVPFLYCLFRTDAFTEHTYAHTAGTTVLHLSSHALPTYRFALPPQNVADVYESLSKPIFQRIEESERQSRTLGSLRDTLLPRLISGEYRVSKAERILEAARA
jgi:type I restriction enzyme S subunit